MTVEPLDWKIQAALNQSMKKNNSNSLMILFFALLCFIISPIVDCSVGIDFEKSGVFYTSSLYHVARVVPTAECSVGYITYPYRWIPKGTTIYIPTSYLSETDGSRFLIQVMFTCSEEKKILTATVLLENYSFHFEGVEAKKDQETANFISSFVIDESPHSIDPSSAEVLRKQSEEVLKFLDSSISSDPNVILKLVLPQNDNSKNQGEYQGLPGPNEIKRNIQTNNTLFLSTILNRVLRKEIRCEKKSAYLLELSAYLHLHLQSMMLNKSQLEIELLSLEEEVERLLIEEKESSQNDMQSQIWRFRADLITGIPKLESMYKKMNENYQKQQQLNQSLQTVSPIYEKVKSQKNITSSLLFRFKIEAKNLNSADRLTSNRMVQARNQTQLISVLTQHINNLTNQLTAVTNQYDRQKILAKQMEVDLGRTMENLDYFLHQQLIIDYQNKTRRSKIIKMQAQIASINVEPLAREISQLQIYFYAIDQQLDIIYFQCYEILPEVEEEGEEEDRAITELTTGQFEEYIENAYNISVRQAKNQDLDKQKIALKSSEVNKNIDKIEQIISNQQQKKVKIIRTSLVDQKWKSQYGNTQKDHFSCLQSNILETSGSGIIKFIWENLIVAQAQNGELFYLFVSLCTRMETVGLDLPRVGQKILWRGRRESQGIQTYGISSFL